jgi:hypothetical protein
VFETLEWALVCPAVDLETSWNLIVEFCSLVAFSATSSTVAVVVQFEMHHYLKLPREVARLMWKKDRTKY